MYPPDWAAGITARLPSLALRDVPGVNHYTILFSPQGARAVADTVRDTLDGIPAPRT
jgi:hypothetical protein